MCSSDLGPGLARDTRRSLLYYAIPLLAGLAATHTFVPPTPGPVAVADIINVQLGWVILFGLLLVDRLLGLLEVFVVDDDVDVHNLHAVLAAPEGIAALTAAHPDVQLYTAAVDSHLNEVGYIMP